MGRNLIGRLNDVMPGDYVSLYGGDMSVRGEVVKVSKKKVVLLRPYSKISSLKQWNLGYRTLTGLFSRERVKYYLGEFEGYEIHPNN